METTEALARMDALVSKGQIVDAIEQFFDDKAVTRDFDGSTTRDKAEAVKKLSGFVGTIRKVNEITLHHSVANGSVTMSEYTFDFDMADGNKVHWHEIIRRVWQQGKVVNEQYFKN